MSNASKEQIVALLKLDQSKQLREESHLWKS